MYEKHFGLKLLPFENVPDPLFFFDDGDHALVRSRITESLKAGQSLMVITGPTGSGKTTLSQMIKSDFFHDVKLLWMTEPPGSSIELFLFIAQELGLEPSIPITNTIQKALIIKDVADALSEVHARGSKCLLIIDEVNLVGDDVLHGIRLLTDLEEDSERLIQILLLGPEELIETINRPEMESFKQRIAPLEILRTMNGERIHAYIMHRIKVAGGLPSLFTDTGWEALDLAFRSGSTPRVINSLCDRSLTIAYDREKTRVDDHDVYEAAKGVGLQAEEFYNTFAQKQIEREQQASYAVIHDPLKETETVGKAIELSMESCGTDMEYDNRGPEPSQSTEERSDNGFSKPETPKKGLRHYCGTFLRMILGKKDGTPSEIKATVMSLEERERGSAQESDVTDVDNKVLPKAEEAALSFEWVTVDAKRIKSFKPVHARDGTASKKKETAAKTDEWVRVDAKGNEFTDIKYGKPAKAEAPAPSSEWVRVAAKGANSYKPVHRNDRKPTEKKRTEEKFDEWARRGAQSVT